MRTSQDKRSHSRNESGEEGIERISSDQTAIDELENASQQDAEHIGVDEANLLGRLLRVVVYELADHREHAWAR